MVAPALEALIGHDPGDEAVATALATIPSDEMPEALRLLARQHGRAALPILRSCLTARPDWAEAAAAALGTLATPDAAETLLAAAPSARTKGARTAIRRALYRLRQAGITPATAAAAPRAVAARPVASQAWASAFDGTGSRGWCLVLEGASGERTLLSAILNDVAGVLDAGVTPITKKRLRDRIHAMQAESPLPWVELPATWALALLAEAAARNASQGTAVPTELARWLATLSLPDVPDSPPIYRGLSAEAVRADARLLERSAELLRLPEFAGWFLDPADVQPEALELLQAKESRLVVSDQVKQEREAAIADGVIERLITLDMRQRWQRRLEEQAFVLAETGREDEAGVALAAALALANVESPARRIPFLRALVERSLEVAGEVALGRVPAQDVSRLPRSPHAAAR